MFFVFVFGQGRGFDVNGFKNDKALTSNQGTLTKGEGSVQLTSLY
jgi:hypothetical protein